MNEVTYYVLDEDRKPKVATLEELVKFFQTNDRVIKQDILKVGGDTIIISTVFTGLDLCPLYSHGKPYLYETMVFNKEFIRDFDAQRSRNEEKSLEAHQRFLDMYLGFQSLEEHQY